MKAHVLCFVCIDMEAYATCRFLQTIQQGFASDGWLYLGNSCPSRGHLSWEREAAALCQSVYCVLVINGIAVSEQYVVKFPSFHTSDGISSRPAAFLFYIFVRTTLNSSCINSHSLISHWLLIIFEIGLSVTLVDLPSRFLKCSFHVCICSSWMVTFTLAHEVFFLLRT